MRKFIMITFTMIITLMIVSCAENKKAVKKDAPAFKVTGDVMETHFPDGSASGARYD